MPASMYAPGEVERNYRVTTQQLGSGWAAVMLVDIHDDVDHVMLYVDVQQTGQGRYATQAEAEREARSWADAEELPFVG